MEKSDIGVVQQSTCVLRGMSLELRLFIEMIACSSCPNSARSSQSLSAESEPYTQRHGLAASGRTTTHGRHSGEPWARPPCSEMLAGTRACSRPSRSPGIFPASAGPR